MTIIGKDEAMYEETKNHHAPFLLKNILNSTLKSPEKYKEINSRNISVNTKVKRITNFFKKTFSFNL